MTSPDRFRILAAAFLRALGVGMVGVLFGLYLARGGLHAGQVGLVVAAGLAGLAAGTFLVSFWADRIGRRRTLMVLALATGLGGWGVALFPSFPVLVAVAFFGMVNAMGRERGALFSLEQAILPETASPRQRTQVLAWYNLLLDVGMALGSLLGSLPFFLRKNFGLADFASYQCMFALYGTLGLAGLLLYRGLSSRIEIHQSTPWHKVSPASRRIITRISLLFGLDSLGGGFLPAALISYWFFKRFGIGEEMLGPFFLIAHLVNAPSYLVAAWVSRHLGLIKTMVFSHVPANLCLLAIPFAPSLTLAMGLYLVREFLVEMDVPTRQSYVLAVVEPNERTIASGVTNLTRSVAWAIGPSLAGYAMRSLALSTPLFIGGGLKVVYDLCLYYSFRRVKPLEERQP